MMDSPKLPPHYELIPVGDVDSVVAEAARRAAEGAGEGTLVWATEQTDALTRGGHRWFSPPGNMYCALVLRPEFSNERSGQLPGSSCWGAQAGGAILTSGWSSAR